MIVSALLVLVNMRTAVVPKFSAHAVSKLKSQVAISQADHFLVPLSAAKAVVHPLNPLDLK